MTGPGSNLFRRASQITRDRVRREFRQSHVGRLVTEVENITRKNRIGRKAMERLTGEIEGLHSRGVLGAISNSIGIAAGGVVDVAQYAAGAAGGFRGFLYNQLFKALGPIGSVLQALLQPKGKSLTSSIAREITGATKLLKAFGFEVIAPPADRGNSMKGKAAAATKLLESLGFTVTPPGAAIPGMPTGPAIQQNIPGRQAVNQGNQINPQTPPQSAGGVGGGRGAGGAGQPAPSGPRGPGGPRSPSGGQPGGSGGSPGGSGGGSGGPPGGSVSGEMVHVQSSNVHSIGFDFDYRTPKIGTLKVRFLSEDGSAGAMYYYYAVPTAVFKAFLKASSKGKFVWDKLRIRGSVSGHQFDYALGQVSQGYVPRKATRLGDEEWYIQRQFTGPNVVSPGMTELGRNMKSALPNAYVGLYGQIDGEGGGGKPNRGKPNRGGPNRGGPNRGGPSRGK